ncbi:hypothetical protein CAOG_03451 [Capsaspora owczarzaki ATCC 30864]|nr:hypothetical protein CAOG_03451 [Capsaspora owczarzaki ATCC 30864]|eukprot:XP_004364290.1 hypothetical protein CAOG_03451 [Capsaspora owczarzaki ATCC 30864]
MGVLSILPCSFGFVGNATRMCFEGQVPAWGQADTSHCRSVESVLAELISTPVTAENLQSVADGAATLATQAGALDGGQLGSLAGLLSDMSAVGAAAGWPGSSSYSMMNVFDSILGSTSDSLTEYQASNKGEGNYANIVTSFGYSLLGANATVGSTVTRQGANAIVSATAVDVHADASFTASGTDFHLPQSLFDQLNGTATQALYSVSFVLYQTSDIFPAVNQGDSQVFNVISASVQNREVYNLIEPVTFFMNYPAMPYKPVCSYFDFSRQQWASDGCVTTQLTNSSAKCECYHLTNFALFFSLADDQIDSVSAEILSNITYVGCALSIFGTVVTFVTFVLLRTLRSFAMKLVMHLCVAIFGINVVFLAGALQTDNADGCRAAGVFLHFFLLCSFCWMLSIGVNLFLGIVRLNTDSHIFYRHMVVASYCVPALIVIITMAVDIDNYGGTESCWIQDQGALIGAFYVPVLLVIAANIAMFVMILFAFRRAAKDRKLLGAEERNNARVLLTIFLMLGITWVFGVLAIDSATTALQYLFVIFNSFQGFLIFVFYCCNKRVVQTFQKQYGARFPFSYITSLSARTSRTTVGTSSSARNTQTSTDSRAGTLSRTNSTHASSVYHSSVSRQTSLVDNASSADHDVEAGGVGTGLPPSQQPRNTSTLPTTVAPAGSGTSQLHGKAVRMLTARDLQELDASTDSRV